ncbi:hypothetical protein HBB16_01930 [Pseudonocardia sp. MCCB 268]|nr:hypothetical protein [Pseudonocardia cytotoxica]
MIANCECRRGLACGRVLLARDTTAPPDRPGAQLLCSTTATGPSPRYRWTGSACRNRQSNRLGWTSRSATGGTDAVSVYAAQRRGR